MARIFDLSPAQAADRITALLVAHESRTLDFKRISVKQKSMIEATCAFANSDGGLLVIGVGDAKDLKSGAKPASRLFGIEENVEAFDDFRRHVMQRFVPPITELHWLRVPCTLHNGQPGHVGAAAGRKERAGPFRSGQWHLDPYGRQQPRVECG